MGTGRDNRNGEGERTGDAGCRGGGCSLGVGDITGTGTGRSSGDDDGDWEGDGLFKIFDGRGGGGGGGARLAGSLRSEEDGDDRSCATGPSGGGMFNRLLEDTVGRGLEGAVIISRSVF